MITTLTPELRGQVWRWIGNIVAAHLVMLEQVGTIDDVAMTTVLESVGRVRDGLAPESGSLLQLVALFDERVDSQTAAGAAGVTRLGRGTIDVAATVARCLLREALIEHAAALDSVRAALIDFAGVHTVTLMPASIDGVLAQPTTWGHFLGGAIGPLGRAAARVSLAYAQVNQCPLGAGALASTGLENDRRATAALLGFDDPVPNSFDAVSATDHLAAAAESAAGAMAPLQRLTVELLAMARAEPGSILLTGEAMAALPDVPQVQLPARLESLARAAAHAEMAARSTATLAAGAGYGPVAAGLDGLLLPVLAAIGTTTAVLGEARALIAEGLDINRALLANKAGRAFVTASDLADVLMLEEQIDPVSARSIAALTISRARDEGLEASGITPELIDGAALLVLGQELKVEFEVISRYLAPRRFIERRTAIGAPSPAATRAVLDEERVKLNADRAWMAALAQRIATSIVRLHAVES